ncbi:Homeobox-leucine zipper protein HDG2 [Camellia lanceoleosa]|uniref:Homeobox-leucine zipper protein HDG2 n=1 Tax=Camellia lanceoleosa TaxID=1840588 RepID=A0ACC0GZS7_9ERIC|nr:Homeobox-leucine zipper protein HDG2 [Camellia lanceoleosa]
MSEEEVESKFGGSDNNQEGGYDEDQGESNHLRKKRRYQRHTQVQIQEMENFFKEYPHPDDKQRKVLSRELGLEPLQIKFWFQNKRTQIKNNMLILQESSIDPTGSFVIYAPVDGTAMNTVLHGGNPDNVALLPSGFAVLPDGPGRHGSGIGEANPGGSLVTVSFQILVDSTPTVTIRSVATVNNLITCTVEMIKVAMEN